VSWRNDQRTADDAESEQSLAPEAAPVEAKSSGISPADIYYILFRQKWKLLGFFALALAGAIGTYFLRPPVYQSEAELLVKYVLERKPESMTGPGNQLSSVEGRKDGILSVEEEILTSRDVAEKVAEFVGPEKILAKLGGGDDREKAVGVIMRGTKADAPPRASVLLVTFRHPDPSLVQPVLLQLIASYREKHVQIHRGLGVLYEFLTQQTDQLGSKLRETEDKLRDLKSKAGVISIEDTKKEYVEQLTKVTEDLRNAEALLAQRKATLKVIERAPQPGMETNRTETGTAATPEVLQEYKNLSLQLDPLRKREAEMVPHFKEGYRPLASIRESIAIVERRKKELEDQYPHLVGTVASSINATGQRELDPAVQLSQIAGLEGQIQYLRTQLETMNNKVFSMDGLESTITQLQRQRDLQETNYRYFQANLDQARFDEELGAAKTSGIDVVNSPTPPARVAKETYKLMLQVFAALFGLGVGLALLSEFVIDQSIRRPADIIGKLNGPLFISIPRVALNGKPLLVLAAGNRGLPLGDHSEVSRPANDGNGLPDAGENAGTDSAGHNEASQRKPAVPGLLGAKFGSPPRPGNDLQGASMAESTQEESTLRILFKRRASGVLPTAAISRAPSAVAEPISTPPKGDDTGAREVTPWDPDYKLRPYAEGLRDRIITWFERRGLTHKPKLVAITSCNKGAGVTSIAAGLAAALSETGDGKVLLVDLNLEVGAAHPFYEGRPVCGIMEALDRSQRKMAVVQSNLCVAAGTELNDNQPQTILPRRFTRLIPRLKSSDYDYIIFDMLPVNQTSVTARLCGVMDIALMVIESEKTSSLVAKQATTLLTEAQANVGFVLNKRRRYVPSWLQDEL